MAQWRTIQMAGSGEVLLARARWCQSFWCHFRGLQFRFNLPEDEGLLFVYGRESVVDTSLHMFFMFFSIAAVWLDNEGRVVDAQLARPWRPLYKPAKPARYVIEAGPSLLERVKVGDQLTFATATEAATPPTA